MFKKNIALLILLTIFFNAFAAKINKQQSVTFGENNQLIIDGTTGTFSIKYNGRIVIANAHAAFTTNNGNYQTSNYEKRSVVIKHINDKIGAGKLVTITSVKAGAPVMKQIFYCYSNKDFIITELEIDGHALSSNYMAPIVTSKASLYAGAKLQTLFVPFDNDTFIRYKSKDLNNDINTSAEVGVVYDNESRRGLVTGSLTHDNWKSGVKTSGHGDLISNWKFSVGLMMLL
jgi:alpha-galactosidase